MDWAPTLLAAANVKAPSEAAFDGIDLFAKGLSTENGDRTLFWRMKWMAQEASRRGKWKYLKIGQNRFLFDLSSDPMERANLKAREPVQFASMEAEYRAWERTMLPLSDVSESHGFAPSQIADRYTSPGL
jgi:arylsulfatase A-like enzyme